MSQAPRIQRSAAELWAALLGLPEGQVGQIIDGELHVQPRPRPRHAQVIGKMGRALGAFDDDGGPSGWWILAEPGIELPGAAEIVPDLAGWRRSTLPVLDLDAPLQTRPDWVCEVLSPTNTRLAMTKKLGVYLGAGVEWLWLVNPDPAIRTLQVLQRASGGWLLQQTVSEEAIVRLEPFPETEIRLQALWR